MERKQNEMRLVNRNRMCQNEDKGRRLCLITSKSFYTNTRALTLSYSIPIHAQRDDGVANGNGVRITL